MDIKSKADIDQLYGRMMEDCDIQRAIESGQFKSLNDVLHAVKVRSESINETLAEHGVFNGVRSVSEDEFEMIATQYDAELPQTIKQ